MFYKFTLFFIGSFSQLLFAAIDRNKTVLTSHCYSNEKNHDQRNYYSLETPHPPFSKQKHTTYNIEGCEPQNIWLVTRHGTRYPDTSKFRDIAEVLPVVRDNMAKTGELCQADYDLLTGWKMNKTRKPCDLVRPQGWTDLHELAQSFKAIYPPLFSTPYSPESYTFSHSSAIRTKDSCKAFAESLFGHKKMVGSQKYWSTNDTMLRPWSFCKNFKDYLAYLNTFTNEMDRFGKSKPFEDLKTTVSRRLGMIQTMKHDVISLMWDECKYQQDFHLDYLSPWCAAFTVDEAVIFEYLADLDFYYKYSYGNPLSSVLPCTLIKSMLESTISPTKVTVNFAHAELLSLLITALGAKHDRKPLLAENFEEQHRRKFKVSKLVPFASNFAAVTYNCSLRRSSSSFSFLSQSSNVEADTKILMLLNQEPIDVPWCVGGSICTINEMSQMFHNSGMRNCPYGICGDSFVNPKIPTEDTTC